MLKLAEKVKLNVWQRTNEGRKIVVNYRRAFYASKKRLQEKDDAPINKKKSKALKTMAKQQAEIAALKKELNTIREKDKENDITAEVAALLNTSKNVEVPNNEDMSVAQQVKAIVARTKKGE